MMSGQSNKRYRLTDWNLNVGDSNKVAFGALDHSANPQSYLVEEN